MNMDTTEQPVAGTSIALIVESSPAIVLLDNGKRDLVTKYADVQIAEIAKVLA